MSKSYQDISPDREFILTLESLNENITQGELDEIEGNLIELQFSQQIMDNFLEHIYYSRKKNLNYFKIIVKFKMANLLKYLCDRIGHDLAYRDIRQLMICNYDHNMCLWLIKNEIIDPTYTNILYPVSVLETLINENKYEYAYDIINIIKNNNIHIAYPKVIDKFVNIKKDNTGIWDKIVEVWDN